MKFNLPELKFEYAALEPYIDGKTMEIHHQKHHGTYITNLNNALDNQEDFATWEIEDLLKGLDQLPEAIRMAVRNNGGGHYNHTLFWEALSPKGGVLKGEVIGAIEEAFGSFEAFKAALKDAALKRFGSGWAWLVLDNGVLKIVSTPNQDAPLSQGMVELLGLDVWEHAYYLNYQNRRADYVDAFWNVVDWDVVELRYQANKPIK